jgi:hypothetical protein
MKKVVFIFCLILGFLCPDQGLFSQTSDGFNYQAVVRNAAGNVLVSQLVSFRFSILQGSQTGTVVYAETKSLSTNSSGLINLVIGQGTPVTGIFSSIDWSNGPYFLKIDLDPAGGSAFSTLETKQIMSVPFAIHSKEIQMPLENLEVQEPELQNPEEALFEVKRKDGSPVFAVYNEGVRMYVNDDQLKGTKGGFAVGGYDPTKGFTREYFRVTPDSVRIFIKNQQGKASKGGFAVGGYDPHKSDAIPFLRLTPENYFIGHDAGSSNTTGKYNSFIGYKAGFSNTEGEQNSFIGYYSGYSNTTGYGNIFIGDSSGYSNTTGQLNVLLGIGSGQLNTTGSQNIYLGDWAGCSNTTGNRNIYIGTATGWRNTIGYINVFIGNYTGAQNTSGTANVMIGRTAGFNNTTGSSNTFIGAQSGITNTTGSNNVYIGQDAGRNTNGQWNVFIGNSAGYNETGSNKLYIENSQADNTNSLIYGEFDKDYLSLNALTSIRDALILQPQTSVPANPTKGMMYFDGNDNKLKIYDGSQWHSLW